MSFYYDHVKEDFGLLQYSRYLENESYMRRLKSFTADATNYQLLEIRRTLSSVNPEAKENFEKLTSKVCGTMEKGLSDVVSGINTTNQLLEDSNWRLNEIQQGIDELHSMLDWKTDLIIEELRINNLYLGRITELLKIPDSQRQRGYYVEQGLGFLKNAFNEGPYSDFYSEALDEFSKAYDIESKDYFTLHKMGIIHFSSRTNLNIEKAEQFFKAAARYALAAGYSMMESGSAKKWLLVEAASALNYASRCNYILNRKQEAIKLARQAFDIANGNPEIGIHLGKVLAANQEVQSAISILSSVIDTRKEYFIKILSDPDFFSNKEIAAFLEMKAEKFIQKMENRLSYLEKRLIDTSVKKHELLYLTRQLKEERTFYCAVRLDHVLNEKGKYQISKFTYDDHYLRYKKYGSRSFKTGIRQEAKQYELTLSEVIEQEHANYQKLCEYQELDILQKAAALESAAKAELRSFVKRTGAILAALSIFIVLSTISGFITIIFAIFAVYFISQVWEEYLD